MKFIILFAVLSTVAFSAILKLEDGTEINDRPIIGVFAYPSEFNKLYPTDEYTYIAASYIKWIEQSGARAMPIPYDLEEQEMKSMFSKVNGLLFPGGFWDIFEDMEAQKDFTELAEGAVKMFNLALQANYDGDYFPIYGIQSGLQLLLASLGTDASGRTKMFSDLKLQNWAAPIQYMRNGTDEMWSYQDQETMQFTSNNNAAFYFSNFTVSVKEFLRNEKLRNTFEITAMSEDENGQKFVCAVQGKNLPIYGTQFFAQGNIFEWKTQLKLDHHPVVIDFQQQLANFLVQKSRLNIHDYKIDDAQDELLIYNFQAMKLDNAFFEQLYFLPKNEIKQRLFRTNLKLAQLQQVQA